jgi:hypothetical protein
MFGQSKQGDQGEAEPQPQPTAKPKTQKRAKPRSPFPEGWEFNNKLFSEAVKWAGWDRARAEKEFDAFRDHHLSKATMSADWIASWRTWCRNGAKYDAGRKARGGNGSYRSKPTAFEATFGDDLDKSEGVFGL